MAQDLEILFARAQAAMWQSRQLLEGISLSRQHLRTQIAERRMRHFTPVDCKISYPQDFPRPAYLPFSVQTDTDES